MPPPYDDGKRLSANGQPEPSAVGESCGFGLGRLPKSGATAATTEGAYFGDAEAAANGEQGAKGVEARAIVRLSSGKRVERVCPVLAVGSLFTFKLLPNEVP